MQRFIVEQQSQTDAGVMIRLDCGHTKYVEGITAPDAEGLILADCKACERLEMPAHFVAYKKTPVFNEQTIPNGLRKDHTTATGVWGKIVILSGNLHYHIDQWNLSFELSPGRHGTVSPGVLHYIKASADVQFYVEFYRAPSVD